MTLIDWLLERYFDYEQKKYDRQREAQRERKSEDDKQQRNGRPSS